MKLVSWNVNGYRAITGQNSSKRFDQLTKENKLFNFIDRTNPDIIGLQETKSSPDQIIDQLLAPAGYNYFYSSCKIKKGYSGVVIFSKEKPNNVITEIGIDKFDDEGRVVCAEYNDFTLLNIYFPSGTSGMHRVDYKLEFYDALFNFIEQLRKKQKNILICGDYNTAHKEIDIARPKENEKNSGFMPIEREKLDWITSLGYTDCFRNFSNQKDEYTWWSQRGSARANNVGWRIDYFFATQNLMPKIKNCYHLQQEQGSDHCPVVLEMD